VYTRYIIVLFESIFLHVEHIASCSSSAGLGVSSEAAGEDCPLDDELGR
jgi:hypothetical protein